MYLKKYLPLVLISAGIFIGGATYTTANAKYVGHNATPTEIRGTWYQYSGNNKFYVVKIAKHNVYSNGKLLYSTKNKGYNKLYVKKYTKHSGDSWGIRGNGTSYILNGHYKYDYQTTGQYWLSHQKVSGHRVLKNYHQMGQYNVFTKNKVKYNYSYHKDSFKDIGR